MQSPNIYNTYRRPSFGRFIKISGHSKELLKYREELRQKHNNFISIASKSDDKESILYLFSGKHLDKFIDLIKNIDFRDLKTYPEKYLKSKPKELSLEQAEKLGNIFKEKI